MDLSTAPGETVCHLVHQLDFFLNRENGRVLEPYGVTVYQAMSLIYVADHECHRTVNQRALERYTQLSNPGVTKLVTALEKQGLLERTHDPEDARSYVLRTTEQGRAQCEIFRSLLLDTDRSLTQNLSASEVDQLKLLLHKIYA
jgi:DNA-binding MarR family transcriptional regulator